MKRWWFTTCWIPEFITAAQLELMRNLKQTSKLLHYRDLVSGSQLSHPNSPDQYALWSRLYSSVYMRWKRNDNPIDPSNWLIYKRFLFFFFCREARHLLTLLFFSFLFSFFFGRAIKNPDTNQRTHPFFCRIPSLFRPKLPVKTESAGADD